MPSAAPLPSCAVAPPVLVNSWATIAGTVSAGSPVAGGSVYAINTETGDMTSCELGDTGEYTLNLPGVADPDLRAPGDFWLIVANPPVASNDLASSSMVLRSSTVANGEAVTGRDFALGTPTVEVSLEVLGMSGPGKNFACSYSDSSGPLPIACALSQDYDPTAPVARLALPSGNYFIDGFSYRGGSLYEGYHDGPVTSPTTEPVVVSLTDAASSDCLTSNRPGTIAGLVRRAGVPARSKVWSFAMTEQGPRFITSTWSLPHGPFLGCPDGVPAGVELGQGEFAVVEPIMGGPARLVPVAAGNRTSLFIDLADELQVTGSVTVDEAPSVNTSWNVVRLGEEGPEIPPIFQDVRTDNAGSWGVGGLPPGAYALIAYPSDGDPTRAVAMIPFTIADGGPLTIDAELEPGDITGVATRPDGAPVAGAMATLQACPQDSPSEFCEMRIGRTNSQGAFAFALGDVPAFFRVTVEPNESDNDVVSTTSGWIPNGDGDDYLPLTMAQPNVTLRIEDSASTPLAGSWGEFAIFDETAEHGWRQLDGAQADTEGNLRINLDEPGSYRVVIYPHSDNFGPVIFRYFKVEIDTDTRVVSLSQCPMPNSDEDLCTEGLLPLEPEGGLWVLERPDPNVTGTLMSLPTGGVPVGQGQISIDRIEGDEFSVGYGWSQTSSAGLVALHLPPADGGGPASYAVKFSRPWNSDNLTLGDKTFFITADATGACLKSSRLATCNPSSDLNTIFHLALANVSGTVSGPGSQFANISVYVRQGAGEDAQWQWSNTWTNTNSDGAFSLGLEAGTYRLRVMPQSGGVTTLSDPFTLVSNSDTEIVNVLIEAPNISGTVFLPGGVVGARNGYVEVRSWNPERSQYEWTESVPGVPTNQSGDYSLLLPDGRWQIIANPPSGNTTASKVSANVVVSGSTVCVDDGDGGCVGGEWDGVIELTAPNVAGVLQFTGGAPAGNTWIDVRRYDSSLGRYEWDPSLEGISVGYNGRFAATLPDGDYRLIGNPPRGNSLATPSSVDITVTGSYVCLTTPGPGAPCGAGNAIASGALTITLLSPNVQGTVMADGNAVSNSNLQVEKWDPDISQWRWQDMWANSSRSGGYAIRLATNGSYRITAQPTSLTDEYSSGRAYVYVSGSQLCAPTSEESATSGTPCTLGSAPLALDIALVGATLLGVVTNGSDPLRDAWVSLLTRNSSGWFEWVGGTPTRAGGRFALALEDDGSSKEYRIEVFPPWGGNSDLTRKSVDVVAYKSGSSTKVCLSSGWNAATSICSATVGQLTIALSGGNVRGFVKLPSPDDTGVREAGISVEKWVEEPWNPGSGRYVWMWADMFTDTRAGGAYSLNIDTPGIYRLEARPPWNNAAGLSSGKSIITVNDEGRWCTQASATGSTADAFGACEGALSGDDSRLTIRLSTPNVTTRVFSQSGGVPVADAWVGVTRDVVQSVPGTDDTFVSRQWLGGTSTNSTGYAYLNLDVAGSYTLEINPPWQSGTALPRFSKSFTITCGSGSCVESGLDDSVWFPTPNVNGFILGADDSSAKISNAWVSVEKSIGGGEYRWVDEGTSSNGKGRYILSLDNGSYRLTAWPAWDNAVGVPRTVNVTVTGGVASCTSGCASPGTFDIQLRKANVSGSLVYGSPSQAMPFGWVEVRQGGSFVAGAGSNAQGLFSMNLGDGTYTFTAYPNWGVAAKPPVTTTVVVAGGVVTAVGGSAASSVQLDFDAVVPSLVLNVGGNVTGNRFVTVAEWTGSAWSDLPSSTAVASSGIARFTLPPGTYRFTVVPGIGTSATDNTVDVTIDADPATMQTSSVNPTEVGSP